LKNLKITVEDLNKQLSSAGKLQLLNMGARTDDPCGRETE
jgi:hypothetical protein